LTIAKKRDQISVFLDLELNTLGWREILRHVPLLEFHQKTAGN